MNMKHRYIVSTFVEASSPQEALRLARKTSPHEVYLDNEVWKQQGYALRDSKTNIGFQQNARIGTTEKGSRQ